HGHDLPAGLAARRQGGIRAWAGAGEAGGDHLFDALTRQMRKLNERNVLERPGRSELGPRREHEAEAWRWVRSDRLRAAHFLHEQPRHLERRGIGPVKVLEREHERAFLRQAQDERDDRLQRQLLPTLGGELKRLVRRIERYREQRREERQRLGNVEPASREHALDGLARGEQQLDDRTERARLVLLGASGLEPARGGDAPAELVYEARLPDAGLAAQEQRPRPSRLRSFPEPEQLQKLPGAADERRLVRPPDRVEPTGLAVACQPEDRDAAGLRPRAELARGLDRELAAEEPLGVAAHQDLARLGQLVEPGCGLRREADEVVEALVGRMPQLAHHDEAGVNPDAHLEPEPALGLQAVGGAYGFGSDRERRSRRPPRVVLAHTRVAEDEEHAVGEDTRYLSAGTGRELCVERMLRVQRLVHLLGVERPALQGRHREPARDDRQLAALPLAQLALPQRLGRRRPLVELDRAQGVEQRFDGDVALLDLLRGDDLQHPAETLLAQPGRDRDGVGAELLP